MNIEPIYTTNEVKGSFWRPDDYMSRVPNAHIIGKMGNLAENNTAARLTLSAEGKQKAEQNPENTIQFASEDGIVRRLSYNIHSGELSLVDFAV